MAPYLQNLIIPKYRRAFTLVRLNVPPSAILEGRFQRIPLENRVCPCGDGSIESVAHVLLSCTFYKDLRKEVITPLLLSIPGRSTNATVSYLLADQDNQVTAKTAKFLVGAMKIRSTI